MQRTTGIAAALVLALLASGTQPARADFSACAAALEAKEPRQKIDLYTLCLKHGGLGSTDVAGAFNNRGVAYQQLGQTDKALQDYIWATQYDPHWPLFRANRAAAEASKGQCAEAVADIKLALKMSPHDKQLLGLEDQIVSHCPVPSKPAS